MQFFNYSKLWLELISYINKLKYFFSYEILYTLCSTFWHRTLKYWSTFSKLITLKNVFKFTWEASAMLSLTISSHAAHPHSKPIRTYVHTCMHTYVHTYICTYIIYRPIYTYVYIHIYIYVYIYVYIYIYVHTYIHNIYVHI